MVRYNVKIVVAGGTTSIAYYERGVMSNRGGMGRRGVPGSPEASKCENQFKSAQRARKRLTTVINLNNSRFSKFLTLTFRSNSYSSLPIAYPALKAFNERLRRHFGQFAYVAVPEYQHKRGVVHFHILNDLDYIHYSILTDIWGLGNIDIRHINDTCDVGKYICKYLGKGFSRESKDKNNKYYTCSQNLRQQPLTVRLQCKDVDSVLQGVVGAVTKTGQEKLTTNVIDTEYLGQCLFIDIIGNRKAEDSIVASVKKEVVQRGADAEITDADANNKELP